MANELVSAAWSLSCQQLQSHAQLMGHRASPTFAQLMANVAARFCSQTAPSTQAELSFRQLQAICLSSMIGSIAHADSMVRNAPDAEQELHELSRHLSERPLPITREDCAILTKDLIAFAAKVDEICHTHSMHRIDDIARLRKPLT